MHIPRNFAHQRPHMTENQERCRFQGFMHSMIQKSKLLCPELPGLPKVKKLPETAANPDTPSPIKFQGMCQGPSQRRHLKQKKDPFRNVGGMWAKRGWKRGRNRFESGMPGGMVWFGFVFFGAMALCTQGFSGTSSRPFQMCTCLLQSPLQNMH